MRPAQAVSDVVRDIKSNSSAAAFATFSRLSEIIKMDVLWAAGYLAESVSPGDLQRVKRYIINQPGHHGQSSNFEPGRMRNTSIMARPHPGFRGHRRHETPTAHAVGIVL